MNLNQLIYFVTLARLEHVTRASEKLNIAQPSLSKAISGLEQELGVDLLQRRIDAKREECIWIMFRRR